MHDMKMTESEYKDDGPCDVESKSKYPYGLTLHLDKETIDKLGIEKMPGVGSQMELKALVSVIEVSMSERKEGEPERRMDLQITEMELSSSKKERDVGEELYGVPKDATKDKPIIQVEGV